LKIDVMTVAKVRLRDFIKDKQDEMGDDSAVLSGKMTMAESVAIFRQRLDGQQNIKAGTKIYRRKCLEALLKSWPDLKSKPVRKVGKEDCLSLVNVKPALSEVDVLDAEVQWFADPKPASVKQVNNESRWVMVNVRNRAVE